MAPRGRTFNAQGEYIIGLNDKVTIRVIGSNDINGEFVVSQAGTVSLPLIGAVQAAWRTERDLARILTEQYRTYLKNPSVSVGVTGYDSYKIYITGEVRRPGVFTFQEKTTLLQGIATAGGLGEFARGKIILHRAGKNGVIDKYVTDYESVLKGQDRLDGFLLERGDVINVY
jgi:polysaccharide export outer membrane protein